MSTFTRRTSLIALAITLTFTACKKAAPPVDDATLATQLQSRLASDTALSAEPIQVSVQNAVATLNGSVSNDAARSLAGNDAAQVTGIRTVVNNLTVASPVPAPVAAAPIQPMQPMPPQQPQRPMPPPPMRQPTIVREPVQSAPPPAPIVRNQPPMQPVMQGPPPPPPPVIHNITVPAGTTIPVRVTQTLDSATTQPGDPFSGVVSADVVIDGMVVIPQGAPVAGRVDNVHDAGHYSGNSLLSVTLVNLTTRGERIALSTDSYSKEGAGRGKNTAEKVGGGAAVGAILGGIFGGGKGAAIGAAAGGGTGAAVNGVTRGQQVQIPSESLVRFQLASPIVVRMSAREQNRVDDGLQHRQ